MAELESELYYAIDSGNTDSVRRVLRAGGDANAVFWGSSFMLGSHWTALHICCQKGLCDCAEALIDAGLCLRSNCAMGGLRRGDKSERQCCVLTGESPI